MFGFSHPTLDKKPLNAYKVDYIDYVESFILFMSTSLQHVAFIMDGNGRWARDKGLSRIAGHENGARAFKRILKACSKHGIAYVTVYAFSSENWRRPASEVNHLLGLLETYLAKEQDELLKEGIRLRVIGERERMPPPLLKRISEVEKLTEDGTTLNLQVAFNYGSRAELTQAAKRLAGAVKRGDLSVNDINEATLEKFLYTSGLPDPDLLIRTSGEQRLSNYLLWQLAYAEFVFVDKYWPDFTEKDLDRALDTFRGRTRRFGRAA